MIFSRSVKRYRRMVNLAPLVTLDDSSAPVKAANVLAVQQAFDNARVMDGDVVWPNGRVYGSSRVRLRDNVRVIAGGPLSEWYGSDGTTKPQAGWTVSGAGPQIHDMRLTFDATARESGNPNNTHALWFVDATDFSCIGTHVTSCASAAFLAARCKRGVIEGCTAEGSYADGFHATERSQYISFYNDTVINSGDDMFAVVGYASNADYVQDIVFERCQGNNSGSTTNGRGMASLGGKNILFDRMAVRNVGIFGAIIGSDSTYQTFGTRNCTIRDSLIDNTGEFQPVDADGIRILGRSGSTNGEAHTADGVTLLRLDIRNTTRHGIEVITAFAANISDGAGTHSFTSIPGSTIHYT